MTLKLVIYDGLSKKALFGVRKLTQPAKITTYGSLQAYVFLALDFGLDL